MTQPEALKLADDLQRRFPKSGKDAAAELRRLQSLNTELLAALKKAYHAMVHLELSDSSRREWEDAKASAQAAITKGEAK